MQTTRSDQVNLTRSRFRSCEYHVECWVLHLQHSTTESIIVNTELKLTGNFVRQKIEVFHVDIETTYLGVIRLGLD